nr:MAG TPA: hypothetical protein [Caudoviricetes sp.]
MRSRYRLDVLRRFQIEVHCSLATIQALLLQPHPHIPL